MDPALAASTSSPGRIQRKIKTIHFLDGPKSIVVAEKNDFPPIIAICNALLLSEKIILPATINSEIKQKKLLSLVKRLMKECKNDIPEEMFEVLLSMLPKLMNEMNINLIFRSIHDFSPTLERLIADCLRLPFYHGFIVDPKDKETTSLVGSKSHNQIKEFALLERDMNGKFKSFLTTNPRQLTAHGYSELLKGVPNAEPCLIFHDDRLNTMFKHAGKIYILVADADALNEPRRAWKVLDQASGDPVFVTDQVEELENNPEFGNQGVCCYHSRTHQSRDCISTCIFGGFLMYVKGGQDFKDWEYLLENSIFDAETIRILLEDAKPEDRRDFFETLVRMTRDFEEHPKDGPYANIQTAVKAALEVKHILERLDFGPEHQDEIKECIHLMDVIVDKYKDVIVDA